MKIGNITQKKDQGIMGIFNGVTISFLLKPEFVVIVIVTEFSVVLKIFVNHPSAVSNAFGRVSSY